MFNWQGKASNAILLDENTSGKGRYFKARFLQPGLVKYSFGVCILSKEAIDRFVNDFVGCPVIIDHQDVTSENAKDVCCGDICHVWYDDNDGWYWLDGIIHDERALSLIDEGYNVSCQYEITEYANNRDGALHNGNEYDKVILNGKPEHLAIVKNPRYENALIAVNAIAVNEDEQQFRTADDGHVYPLMEYSKSFGELAGRAAVQLDKLKKLEEQYNQHRETYYSDTDEAHRKFLQTLLDHGKKEIEKMVEELKASNKKDEDGKWITIKGTHVFVKDGQSVEEAMKEIFGDDDSQLTSLQIAHRKGGLLQKMDRAQRVGLKSEEEKLCKRYDKLRTQEAELRKKTDALKDKYAKEDADFDIDEMNKDVKFLKDEGYSIEEAAEHLGLDEDEVRMSGVFDDEIDEASNSIVDQFKDGLYNIAANKIVNSLKEEGYLK